MASFEIKWRAPEFEYRQKTVSWYWISIIIAAIILGVAVWQKNFLFGFFVILAEILIMAWANREPPLVDFILNEQGLSLGGSKFYAFAEMESFSIDDYSETEWPSLFFQFHSRLKPDLKIKLPKARMTEIQKTLQPVLAQVEHKHSMIDTLQEFIGF
ncbi:MAG: hypothetical protein Q7R94_01175 [bacterium]|nr:hypothetical protein [bacterium]